MSLVVSDTSPVRALASIGHLELLPRMYKQILVPPAVARELAQPPKDSVVVLVDPFSFLIVRQPMNEARVRQLQEQLDAGEAEAITLASELGAVLLIDEQDGRTVATSLGVRVTGVIGILLEAKRASYIKAIRPLLDELRQQRRFFLSDQFYHYVLQRAEE